MALAVNVWMAVALVTKYIMYGCQIIGGEGDTTLVVHSIRGGEIMITHQEYKVSGHIHSEEF